MSERPSLKIKLPAAVLDVAPSSDANGSILSTEEVLMEDSIDSVESSSEPDPWSDADRLLLLHSMRWCGNRASWKEVSATLINVMLGDGKHKDLAREDAEFLYGARQCSKAYYELLDLGHLILERHQLNAVNANAREHQIELNDDAAIRCIGAKLTIQRISELRELVQITETNIEQCAKRREKIRDGELDDELRRESVLLEQLKLAKRARAAALRSQQLAERSSLPSSPQRPVATTTAATTTAAPATAAAAPSTATSPKSKASEPKSATRSPAASDKKRHRQSAPMTKAARPSADAQSSRQASAAVAAATTTDTKTSPAAETTTKTNAVSPPKKSGTSATLMGAAGESKLPEIKSLDTSESSSAHVKKEPRSTSTPLRGSGGGARIQRTMPIIEDKSDIDTQTSGIVSSAAAPPPVPTRAPTTRVLATPIIESVTEKSASSAAVSDAKSGGDTKATTAASAAANVAGQEEVTVTALPTPSPSKDSSTAAPPVSIAATQTATQMPTIVSVSADEESSRAAQSAGAQNTAASTPNFAATFRVSKIDANADSSSVSNTPRTTVIETSPKASTKKGEKEEVSEVAEAAAGVPTMSTATSAAKQTSESKAAEEAATPLEATDDATETSSLAAPSSTKRTAKSKSSSSSRKRKAPTATSGTSSLTSSVDGSESARKRRRRANLPKPSKAQLQTLVEQLKKSEWAWPFENPVSDTEVPEYKDTVFEPIDLQTLQKLIANETVTTLEQFWHQLSRMLTNAVMFNEPDSLVYGWAVDLEAEIKTLLSELWQKICAKSGVPSIEDPASYTFLGKK